MSERRPARPAICFEAEMRKVGRWTIVELPADASAELPSRGQVAVRGVINRREFETVLEPDGRRGHWLRIDEKLRRALKASEGDVLAFEVEPTKDWPEPAIPKDFRAASGRRARHIRVV